ncbi:hypothetical protein EJ04DRAFT_45331 [Polyplosphaeria fusca]|uniref:Uncharacterized protein n=1 Tax=Polyplosphaeria fusca TaxID=682080 RepID=A0A9P4QSA2_9PLEO|nr:hypothetical protein EJ04DRAFT_45331 [Polyplosphaeria fusca]
MRSAFRHTSRIFKAESHHLSSTVPVFLCPALLRAHATSPFRPQTSRSFSQHTRASQHAATIANDADLSGAQVSKDAPDSSIGHHHLPLCCPGCGAISQVRDKKEAGYYDLDRRHVKGYLEFDPTAKKEEHHEDTLYKDVIKQIDPELLEEMGMNQISQEPPPPEENQGPQTPVCDRCHNLIHHRIGTPIYHPSIEAIHQTIAESPHRRNHIYHVVDAADFPLSLVPNLTTTLRIPKLRTQNRRARHKGWVGEGRIAEISFIITRADLLAPLKEQVDKLLPYMQNVLRDALGHANSKARLGNIYLVSAKRGWWTKKVKEDIWDRGGAGWMVGKVNVGKSNLFEVVFPKGRGADYQDVQALQKIRSAEEREAMLNRATSLDDLAKIQQQLLKEDAEIARIRNQPTPLPQEDNPLDRDQPEGEDLDPEALLPPPQPYAPYPVLPLASSLPGTTASPIRIPYGRNRGELIDLPGLARTNPELTTFVKPEHHSDLVMTHRITATRHVLKPSQSLILGGGLIRITPVTPDVIFLVHPFVPIHPHVTHTEKAMGAQTQTRDSGLDSILLPSIGPKMASAGRFKLKWDATRSLAGPLTSRFAGKMKPENLAFRVWSCDILIEGVGWVEVSAQTRRPRGWKPVGMAKKNPNHARIEKERVRAEKEKKLQDKFASGGGDAFDQAGVTGTREEKEGLEDEGEVADDMCPEIEVFSPLGKYIGVRQPMCGSVLGGPKYVSSRERKARPMRSMVSVKRQRKPRTAS